MTSEEKLRLGGMALRNGLLVHGPTSWSVAVRSEAGGIEVASGRKPRLRATEGVPGLRGVVKLGEAMLVIPIVKRALPEVKLPFMNTGVLVASAVATLAGYGLRKRSDGVGAELAFTAISLAPALLALRGGELAAYHGAEHKAIGGYEADTDAVDVTKEHERCGSHLMAPMLLSNIAGTVLLRSALRSPGPLLRGAVSLGSSAVAVELFAWSERNADTSLARALKRPGYELQRRLGTREPDEAQFAVARAALGEILRVEGAAV